MRARLLTDDLWKRLRSLAAESRSAIVAVPYFGVDGARLLPLKKGSKLIVNCTEHTVKAGQVHPDDLLELVHKGVEVHRSVNLHAKVFVFDATAVVGSANVSHTSQDDLIEAGVELTDPKVVAEARSFVESLQGDLLGPEYLENLAELYRPPMSPPKKKSGRVTPPGRAKHLPIVAVGVERHETTPAERQAEEEGLPFAEEKLERPSEYKLETIVCAADLQEEIPPGTRLLRIVSVGSGRAIVEPVARVLWHQPFRDGRVRRPNRVMVFVEVRKDEDYFAFNQLQLKLGEPARVLTRDLTIRVLTDQKLLAGLARLWEEQRKWAGEDL